MCLSNGDKYLHILNAEGDIICYNFESKKIETEFNIKEDPKGIVCIQDNKVAVLFESLLVVVENGNTVKQVKLDYKAVCIDYNHLTKEILVGRTDVNF
jgi:DNA polymerase II large subunit